MNKELKTGILLVLAAGTLWGFSGVCASFLMGSQENLTSQWLVPYRLLIAGLLLVLINYLKQGKEIFRIWKEDTIRLLVFSIFGMTMLQFSYFTSISASNAGTATVLQQISIILIMLYTCIIEKKKPNNRELIALILAITGVFLMATHGNPKTLVMTKQGLIWGLINAFAVTTYTVIPSKLIKKYGSATVTGWAMLIGGILLQIVFKPWAMNVTVDSKVIGFLSTIIIAGTILPFTMYLKGLLSVGANRAAMLSNIEPVVAALLSVLWLNVSFSAMDIIGSVCILSTIFILSYK